MKNKESLSESFNHELEDVTNNNVLDPAYRKKKLIMWSIRTSISIGLYIVLWKHKNWIKWSLVLTVPLSLFSLFMILGSPYLLKKN